MKNVWTADKTNLSYTMPPDQTISNAAFPSCEKDKGRIRMLLSANATGTEKIFLLHFIANSVKQRCFTWKTVVILGFVYASDNKKCMIMRIICEWFKWHYAFIARKPRGKFLLLLEYFSVTVLLTACPNCQTLQFCGSVRTLHHVFNQRMPELLKV